MCVGQGLCQLDAHVDDLGHPEGSGVGEVAGQRTSRAELHRNEGVARFGEGRVVDGNYVRMVADATGGSALTQELALNAVAQVDPKHFECNQAVEGSVIGSVDGSEPSLSHLLKNLIPTVPKATRSIVHKSFRQRHCSRPFWNGSGVRDVVEEEVRRRHHDLTPREIGTKDLAVRGCNAKPLDCPPLRLLIAVLPPGGARQPSSSRSARLSAMSVSSWKVGVRDSIAHRGGLFVSKGTSNGRSWVDVVTYRLSSEKLSLVLCG